MMANELVSITRRELESWPDVSAAFSNGGKHNVVTLSYNGQVRMVVFAKTLSDTARGTKNHLAQVRRELRALGAARIETAKSKVVKQRAVKHAKPIRVVPVERAPVICNGFDKLAGFTPTTLRPQPSFFNRLWAALRSIFT